MDGQIRLMTHNVWNRDENLPAWEENGEDCSAAARVDGLVQVYLDTQPDIIGGQEVSSLMADLLKEHCHSAGLNYTLIWGRFTPILYRADKFELVDSAFGTYPETIEGYEGSFNDVQSKAWNLGVFREKATGKVFVFATTHLWWKKEAAELQIATLTEKSGTGDLSRYYQPHSDKARELQIAILAEKVMEYREKYNCPVVLVGDLNTGYDSKAACYLRQLGFRHAHDIATEYAEESVGYHACTNTGYEKHYSNKPFEEAIDHIYLLGERNGTVKRFERYSPEYYLPISDHSPAYIDFEL